MPYTVVKGTGRDRCVRSMPVSSAEGIHRGDAVFHYPSGGDAGTFWKSPYRISRRLRDRGTPDQLPPDGAAGDGRRYFGSRRSDHSQRVLPDRTGNHISGFQRGGDGKCIACCSIRKGRYSLEKCGKGTGNYGIMPLFDSGGSQDRRTWNGDA